MSDTSGTRESRKNRALKESKGLVDQLSGDKTFLQLIIDKTPLLLFQIDYNGTILYFEGRHQGDSKIGRSELIGEPIHDFVHQNNNFSRSLIKCVKEKVSFSSVLRLPNGSYIDTTFENFKLHEKELILGIGTDITSHKVIQTAVEQHLKSLKNIIKTTSHDLREPLRTIVTHTQILERNLLKYKDDIVDDLISTVVTNGKKIYKLITEALHTDKLDEDLEIENVEVNDILGTINEYLTDLINKNGVSLTFDEMPAVRSNERLLHAIFQNLISNGIKYNSKNEKHISITYKEQPDFWLFTVSDNGRGIPKTEYDRIFVRSHRLDNKEIEGSGFGLAICKENINRLGGSIWLDSKVDTGTSFYFTLPKRIARRA